MLYCYNCHAQSHYDIVEKPPHHQAICRGCGKYIKNLPHDEPKFYVGKYKGIEIRTIDDKGYLTWARDNMNRLSESTLIAIERRLSELNSPLLK